MAVTTFLGFVVDNSKQRIQKLTVLSDDHGSTVVLTNWLSNDFVHVKTGTGSKNNVIKEYSFEYLKAFEQSLLKLDRHWKILDEATKLITYHGENIEVFGRHNEQQFIMDFRKEVKVGLVVSNPSLSKALRKDNVGLDRDGNVVSEGTPIAYRNLKEYIEANVETELEILQRHENPKVVDIIVSSWKSRSKNLFKFLDRHFAATPRFSGTNREDAFERNDEQLLLDNTAVAQMLGVSMTTFHKYRNGYVPPGYPQFPKYDRMKGQSPLWYRRTVRNWVLSKRP